MKAFGKDRILFGTDFTGYDPVAFIAGVKSATEDTDAREMIFSKNIVGLLAKIGGRTF